MNVLVKEMNERHIAFLTAPCGYKLNATFVTWDRIIHWDKATGIHDLQKKRYAICHGNPMITPTGKCRYDDSIEIDSETEVAAPYSKSLIP